MRCRQGKLTSSARVASAAKVTLSAGFTLLETMIALAILAGVAAAVAQLYASGVETTLDVERESQAYIWAQSKMDEALLFDDVNEAAGQGMIDGTPFTYSISVTDQPYHGEARPGFGLHHIEVAITWGSSAYDNAIRIVSLKAQASDISNQAPSDDPLRF